MDHRSKVSFVLTIQVAPTDVGTTTSQLEILLYTLKPIKQRLFEKKPSNPSSFTSLQLSYEFPFSLIQELTIPERKTNKKTIGSSL